MGSKRISVVIVTKNRLFDLLHAIGSLVTQIVPPDELIVVDNDSTDLTPRVVQKLISRCSFPIRYIKEAGSGYPVIYNRGLKEAKYDWVAFLDDDCVASPDWLEKLKLSISHHRNASVILGLTKPYNPHNSYSLATYIFACEWKDNNSKGVHITNLEILDNKNILYNKSFLSLHHLAYDEDRITHLGGAAEDCDLGKQIQRQSGKAYYIPSIVAFHKEPLSWNWYWKKYFLSLAAYEWYRKKWPSQIKGKSIKSMALRRRILISARMYRYPPLRILHVYFLMYATSFLSILINFFLNFPSVRMRFIVFVERIFK